MRGYVEWLETQEQNGLGTTHEDWIESHLEKVDAARDEKEDDEFVYHGA